MPDLTKCTDEHCPYCHKCYRYISKPDKYGQSYFTESPRHADECIFYWSTEKTKRGRNER